MSDIIGIVAKCEILDNKFHFFITDDEKAKKGKWVQTQGGSAYEKLLLKAFTHKFCVQVSSSDKIGVTYACVAWNKASLLD